jgi:hypothetical protein
MDFGISVSAKKCTAVLGLIVLALVAASVGATFLSFLSINDPVLLQVRRSLVRLTWADGEGNIPAWYSASLLLMCALLLAAIASVQRQRRSGNVLRWLTLSLIFAFLSLDEVAQLHELSIMPLRDSLGTSGFLYYPWIVPGGIGVTLFVASYRGLLAELPARTRTLFLIAGALFIGGALGVEAISGKHASLHGEQTLTYHLIITLEELLEMAGAVTFVYALLDYIGRQFSSVRFHITPSR